VNALVKIAICDDDKEAVKYHGDIVKNCLRSCGIGYEIATYTQSSNLLFDITDDHFFYDLILLDLKMPKLSGEDILKEIRKTRPYVFVIIYTNFSEFADIKALTNIGIDGYVNKGPDADLKELVNIIKEKLEPFSTEDLENIVEAAQIQEEE